MSLFIDENHTPIYPSGWVYDGVQYPNRIFREWTDKQLSSVGVYRVVTEDFVTPEGKEVGEWMYDIEGEIALATPIFVDSPTYIPESVTRAQGKAALLNAGLLEAVEDYINNLSGGQKVIALLAFNETNEWMRDSPFLNQAAAALGVSEEGMDDLFLTASKIVL